MSSSCPVPEANAEQLSGARRAGWSASASHVAEKLPAPRRLVVCGVDAALLSHSPSEAAESLPSGDHEKADPTIEGEALLRYFAVDLLQPIFASRYSQTNQLISSGASLDEP